MVRYANVNSSVFELDAFGPRIPIFPLTDKSKPLALKKFFIKIITCPGGTKLGGPQIESLYLKRNLQSTLFSLPVPVKENNLLP